MHVPYQMTNGTKKRDTGADGFIRLWASISHAPDSYNGANIPPVINRMVQCGSSAHVHWAKPCEAVCMEHT